MSSTIRFAVVHPGSLVGKPTDPAYWRKWRAAHPEYRAREKLRLKTLKAAMTPEERRRDRGGHKPVAPLAPMPVLHLGHELFDRAREVAGCFLHPDSRTFVYDPLWDDLVSEITVALVAGDDPMIAAATYLRDERRWKAKHSTGRGEQLALEIGHDD